MKKEPNTLDRTAVEGSASFGRRGFLAGGIAAALAVGAYGQTREYRSDAPPVRYPDKDILVLDQRFAKYRISNTPIQRLFTGTLWAEGPAWNGAGNYLVWSDIPGNMQHRWLAEDGHVSTFRDPSNNSNGNTFDYEGRQISCEHATRRVVRYERNGTVTILADKWQSKPFNSPNDVVVHPDGGIWFTDPGYGSLGNYEGNKGDLQLKEAVYRLDPKTGGLQLMTDQANEPNGICFSPDYRKLYVSDTGASPGQIKVWDLTDGKKIANGREFASMKLKAGDKEMSGGGDGIRADTEGNIWTGAWGGEGFDGVHCFAPNGERIGQILLPEATSNLCFGGPKRNRLFITASQSLYAVYVGTQGAHIA